MENAIEIQDKLRDELAKKTGYSKLQIHKATIGFLNDKKTFELHMILIELGILKVGVDYMTFWNKK